MTLSIPTLRYDSGVQTDIGVGNLKLENLKLETNTGTRVRGRYLCAVFGEVGKMKKIVNIICAVLHVSIMLCIAPVYLCIAPVVTAIQWGGIRKLRYSLPFEVRVVCKNLRDMWREDCDAFVSRA